MRNLLSLIFALLSELPDLLHQQDDNGGSSRATVDRLRDDIDRVLGHADRPGEARTCTDDVEQLAAIFNGLMDFLPAFHTHFSNAKRNKSFVETLWSRCVAPLTFLTTLLSFHLPRHIFNHDHISRAVRFFEALLHRAAARPQVSWLQPIVSTFEGILSFDQLAGLLNDTIIDFIDGVSAPPTTAAGATARGQDVHDPRDVEAIPRFSLVAAAFSRLVGSPTARSMHAAALRCCLRFCFEMRCSLASLLHHPSFAPLCAVIHWPSIVLACEDIATADVDADDSVLAAGSLAMARQVLVRLAETNIFRTTTFLSTFIEHAIVQHQQSQSVHARLACMRALAALLNKFPRRMRMTSRIAPELSAFFAPVAAFFCHISPELAMRRADDLRTMLMTEASRLPAGFQRNLNLLSVGVARYVYMVRAEWVARFPYPLLTPLAVRVLCPAFEVIPVGNIARLLADMAFCVLLPLAPLPDRTVDVTKHMLHRALHCSIRIINQRVLASTGADCVTLGNAATVACLLATATMDAPETVSMGSMPATLDAADEVLCPADEASNVPRKDAPLCVRVARLLQADRRDGVKLACRLLAQHQRLHAELMLTRQTCNVFDLQTADAPFGDSLAKASVVFVPDTEIAGTVDGDGDDDGDDGNGGDDDNGPSLGFEDGAGGVQQTAAVPVAQLSPAAAHDAMEYFM